MGKGSYETFDSGAGLAVREISMGKGSYETFDSGAGPTIADKGDYAKEDGATPKNDVVDKAVPTVPQKGE